MRHRSAPLWLLAGGGAFAIGVLTGAAVAAGLVLGGDRLSVAAVAPGIVLGMLVTVSVAILAGAAADRVAEAVRALRAEAVERLADPGVPARGAALALPGARVVTEIGELARTLDALHLRARVADEVAQRHRSSAETAGAGVFELLSGLVAAEEGARGQLSAELHDTAAQSLAQARRLLADVAGRGATPAVAAGGTGAPPAGGPASGAPASGAPASGAPASGVPASGVPSGAPGLEAALPAVADLVTEAEDQVRAVMARTRPPALRDGDLGQAVAALRDDFALRYALRVDVTWPRVPRPLPLITAVTVYRFFQEALLNVVKHADGDTAVAELTVGDEGLTAVVRDEGPGFDPGAVRSERGRHVGLGLLRERARLAGGAVDVSSTPGGATTLTLRLPPSALGLRRLDAFPRQREAGLPFSAGPLRTDRGGPEG